MSVSRREYEQAQRERVLQLRRPALLGMAILMLIVPRSREDWVLQVAVRLMSQQDELAASILRAAEAMQSEPTVSEDWRPHLVLAHIIGEALAASEGLPYLLDNHGKEVTVDGSVDECR